MICRNVRCQLNFSGEEEAMKKKIWAAAVIVALAGWTSWARADQRWYVWTYQYLVVPRGQGELEHYVTFAAPDFGKLEGQVSAEHQFELEVGMNGRFDFGIYQVFGQEPGGPFRYRGFKLRARYRLGEPGRFFLNPLAYVEYAGTPDFGDQKLELKAILARDFKQLNLALNPVLELEKEEGEWEIVPEYAAGLSYGLSKLFRAGFELKGSEHGHYFGPVLAHGNSDFWFALGSAFAVTKVSSGKPKFQLRLILGMGL